MVIISDCDLDVGKGLIAGFRFFLEDEVAVPQITILNLR